MPSRRRAAGRYHHGDLRRALLDATLSLAAERGAGGVTLREAARAAGVSQTAPYRHFTDKEQMLAAASEEGFRLFEREMRQTVSAAADPGTQLIRLGETYVRFALTHAAHFQLMFGHGSPPKSASPTLQKAAQDAFQIFMDAVERAVSRSGTAPQDMRFRLWALAHGIASLALEKQVLFDVEIGALLRATREAMRHVIEDSARARSSSGRGRAARR